MIIDILKLEELEKQDVLKLLDVKVQEDKNGRHVGGKKSKVVMKMGGKSDLLKKIWTGMRGPVREYGGTMRFVQKSDASTPAKGSRQHCWKKPERGQGRRWRNCYLETENRN